MPDNNIHDDIYNDEGDLLVTSFLDMEFPISSRGLTWVQNPDVSYDAQRAWRYHEQYVAFPTRDQFRSLWFSNPTFQGYRFRDLWLVWDEHSEDVFICGCNYPYHMDDAHNINGEYMCQPCSEQYQYCERHDNYYSEYDDGCEACEEDGRLIHSYSDRIEVVFRFIRDGVRQSSRRVPDDGKFLTAVTGFELEVESVDGDINEQAELVIDELGDLVMLKQDGSLSHGFEIVTQPMSHEFLREGWDSAVLSRLAKLGARSAKTRTCGLHVHLNKNFFRGRETAVYTLMRTLYDNASQWQALAGRSDSTYASWGSAEFEAARALVVTRTVRQHNNASIYGERYVPMNTNNPSTFEFRFFRGTLRPETLLARVEGIHALAQYSVAMRPESLAKRDFTWERFREWTLSGANATRYNMFNDYASSKEV